MSVQFYGYNFGGTGVFKFFAFMNSFQKLVSDFGGFQTLYVRRDRQRESTTCKCVCEMKRHSLQIWVILYGARSQCKT